MLCSQSTGLCGLKAARKSKPTPISTNTQICLSLNPFHNSLLRSSVGSVFLALLV
jgi:hypothetical protein